MTEKLPVRTNILPSDIDSAGNVTLWDHGPQEPKKFPGDTEEEAKARVDAYEADAKAWHERHGDVTQPIVMYSSDAGHAMTVEPGRYALEPDDIDEGEVEKRVEAMRQKRKDAAEFAQTVIDRKVAIAEIMSERKLAATAEEVEREERPPVPEPHREPKPLGKPLLQPGDDLNV